MKNARFQIVKGARLVILAFGLSGCGKVIRDGSNALVIPNANAGPLALAGGLCYHTALPPQTPVLLLASQPSLACATPVLADLQCPPETPGVWEACIVLGPDLAPPSLVLSGTSAFSTTGPGCDVGEFGSGTLAITSIEPSWVSFTLTGTNGTDPDINGDGTYDAIRCP